MNEHDLQQSLARTVTSLQGQTCEPELLNVLDERFAHRVAVYQRSYRGRVLIALSRVVFEPLFSLYPEQIIQQILARYLMVPRGAHACMIRALSDLPEFIRTTGSGWPAVVLADLTAVCLAKWQLMTGEDPAQGKPLPCYFIAASPNVNLFAAWRSVDDHDGKAQSEGALTSFRRDVNPGVLLIKISPTEAISVATPSALSAVAERLVHGEKPVEALNELLATCSDTLIESLDESDVEHFFAAIGAASQAAGHGW